MNTYTKSGRGATAAGANVIPWTELRSGKEVIKSFAALNKVGGVAPTGSVESALPL